MKVDAANSARNLVEADVIEALKTGAGDGPHPVVGHQEILLPSHENVFPLSKVLIAEIRSLGLLCEGPPRGKAAPVLHVHLLVGTPFWMLGLEGVLRSDYLAFKICCEGWVIVGEA